MDKIVLIFAFLLLLLPGEASAQRNKNKSKPGIAFGEMPALNWNDLREIRQSPANWWSKNMAQSLYLHYDRKRSAELLNLRTREDAYNVSDLNLVVKASEEVAGILKKIPFLSDSKIEDWQVGELNIPVAERQVNGIGIRMEIFRLDFGPFRGVVRTHSGMHNERLTLKELFGVRTTAGLVSAGAKLQAGQRGYPVGGEAIVGVDVLQLILGGRKLRVETGGKNPWSFSVGAELGLGMAFDLSNVYKLPQDWSLIEEIVEQSILELTPWDSQLERDLARVATDLVIKDLSVPKAITWGLVDVDLELVVKKNLRPREMSNHTRYRQIGLYASLGNTSYRPKGTGTPKYAVQYSGAGLFWTTFF